MMTGKAAGMAMLAATPFGLLVLSGAPLREGPRATAHYAVALVRQRSDTPRRPRPSSLVAIGTNVDGNDYWTTALPFLDHFKSSGPWIAEKNGQVSEMPLDLDDRGWVRSLPHSDAAKSSVENIVLQDVGDASPPKSRFVVRYEGEGHIRGVDCCRNSLETFHTNKGQIGLYSSVNSVLHLEIMTTDPRHDGNYLRNVSVIRDDMVGEFDKGRVFNPEFVRKLSGFRVVRFMDWMKTNTIFRPNGEPLRWVEGKGFDVANPDLLSWANRPLTRDAFWKRGIPVEVMVQLANRGSADPWFNMPINASDEYVRSFAQYVRAHLDPQRTVHVEYSNEVWNWGFPQAAYANARARDEWGANANWMEWYGKRTAQVGAIWKRVFGEPVKDGGRRGKVRVVYATQFAYRGLETPGLETPHWLDGGGRHERAADYFDEYAVTGYYDGKLSEDNRADEVIASWALSDGGFGKALADLRSDIRDHLAPIYLYHGGRAAEYGLDFVTYESGFGAVTPAKQKDNKRYTDFLIALQRRPEIYDLDLANVAAFKQAGGKLFMNFGLIAKPSRFGSWAVLESVRQETSPRYRALRDLIHINARSPDLTTRTGN